jgi:hypothetical protein
MVKSLKLFSQEENTFASKKNCQNWSYAQIIFPAIEARQGFFNKNLLFG